MTPEEVVIKKWLKSLTRVELIALCARLVAELAQLKNSLQKKVDAQNAESILKV